MNSWDWEFNLVFKGYGFLILITILFITRTIHQIFHNQGKFASQGFQGIIKDSTIFLVILIGWYMTTVNGLFPLTLHLSSKTLDEPFDISGHTFLLSWSIISLMVSIYSIFRIFYPVNDIPNNKPFWILGIAYIVLVIFSLLYITFAVILLLDTLINYHTIWEKITAAVISLGGYVTIHRRINRLNQYI
jgi:magnesium-transporting ATPase (P-type)